MGCCTSRSGDVIKITREKLSTFIESQKFNKLSCKQIRKLEKKVLTSSEYESLSKSHSISLPFELVEINSKVFPLELKLALLLFSEDSYDEKVKLFNRLLKTPRQRLRFFEWKYQLMNERLPRIMQKVGEMEKDEEKVWVERYRFSAGEEIIMDWEMVKNDGFKPSLEILSVN
jgi:hypothetical protein